MIKYICSLVRQESSLKQGIKESLHLYTLKVCVVNKLTVTTIKYHLSIKFLYTFT